MGLQRMTLESQNAMNAVDGATIERRIRISQLDEGSARCKVSRAWDPRNDSSQCMQQHKIPSTSSAISPQQERTEPSGHRPCRHSVKSSLRREPDVPGDLLRAIFGNVTKPADQLAYFERDLRPAAATSRLPSPEQTKTSTMPTDDSRWLNDHQGIHQLPRIARSTFKFPSPLRFARRMAAFNSPPKIKMEAIM